MPQFNFDLMDGKPKVSFVLHGEDADRFMAFMAECHKATEIADEAMFELMAGACSGIPEPGESLIPLDKDGKPVELVDLACSEIVDAVEWLKPRGVVDVVEGPEGEVILVLRLPGF